MPAYANSAIANVSYIDSIVITALANVAQVNNSAVGLSDIRTIVISNEQVSMASGFEGDQITYSSIVLDSLGNKLPASFISDLLKSSPILLGDQPFSSGFYNQTTGILTLVFIVPYPAKVNRGRANSCNAGIDIVAGSYSIKLNWKGQII